MTMRTMTRPRIQSIAASGVGLQGWPRRVTAEGSASIGLSPSGPEHRRSTRSTVSVGRGLDVLERVGRAELVRLVTAHLVERQDVDRSTLPRSPANPAIFAMSCEVVRQSRHQDVPELDRVAGALRGGERVQRRADVHTDEVAMMLRIPGLDVEQHEVERLARRRQPPAEVAVGVERG